VARAQQSLKEPRDPHHLATQSKGYNVQFLERCAFVHFTVAQMFIEKDVCARILGGV